MPAEEYVKRFKEFPTVGKEVDVVPFFKARVAEVAEQDVRLDFLARNGEHFSESYGSVAIGVAGEKITLTLTPRIGAPFPDGERTGLISAADDGAFTVDFNHPLAGKPVTLDVEVVSIARADTFKEVSLPWQEDHDKALAAAKQAGKPAVLVLYAEWCQWCKKTFAETMQDPRIKELKESFVWAKVNSNQQTQFKEKYGQSGFPMIVLLNPDGTVAGKIDGFRDGAQLAAELRAFLAGGERKPAI
jgi:FKBP-type peptidyl-prolyl cis-trans isomerase 2